MTSVVELIDVLCVICDMRYVICAYIFRLGKVVSGSPWITIFISLAICGVCLLGVLKFTKENRVDKLWTPQDSTVQRHKLWIQKNFPAQMRVSSVLLVAVNVLTPEVMKEVRNQSKSTTANYAENSSTEDVCTAPVLVKLIDLDKSE